MFDRLKGFALALCGHESAPPARDWKKDLRDKGYIVYERHGAWHWRHPESGSQSGNYSSMQAAYTAAQLDWDAIQSEGVQRCA